MSNKIDNTFSKELNNLKRLSSLLVEQTAPMSPFGRAARQLEKDRAAGVTRPLDLSPDTQEKLGQVAPLLPGIGTVASGIEAAQAARAGNLPGAAAAVVGAIPGVKPARKLFSFLPAKGPDPKKLGGLEITAPRVPEKSYGYGTKPPTTTSAPAPASTASGPAPAPAPASTASASKPAVSAPSKEAEAFRLQKAEQDAAFAAAKQQAARQSSTSAPKGAAKREEPRIDKDIRPGEKAEPYLGSNPAGSPAPKTSTAPTSTAPTSTAPRTGTGTPGNLEIRIPKSPGGSVGTDITGAASRSERAPSIQTMWDKPGGPPAAPGTVVGGTRRAPAGSGSQSGSAGSTPAGGSATPGAASASPAATTARPRPGLSDRKAVAGGAAVGTAALGAAYSDDVQNIIKKIIGQNNSSASANNGANNSGNAAVSNTPGPPTITPAEAGAAAPAAGAAAPAAASGVAAGADAGADSADSARRREEIVNDLVSQAIDLTPFTISDEEKSKRAKERELTRARAMNFLTKGNLNINPDAWSDRDQENLAKLQTGPGVLEDIRLLQKLSGMIK